MKFCGHANLVYQLRAIEAVADLFDGQTRFETGMALEVESDVVATNRLDLDEAPPLGNLHVGAAPPDPARMKRFSSRKTHRHSAWRGA
jgi:hypothetical protein